MKHNYYHKTVQIPPELHNKFVDGAVKQNEMVLEFFRYAPEGLTSWEVLMIMTRFKDKPSNRSCSRAVSDLFKDDKLIDTGLKRFGEYKNRHNTVYAFNPNPKPKIVDNWKKVHRVKLRGVDIMLIRAALEVYIQEKNDDLIQDMKKVLEKLGEIE